VKRRHWLAAAASAGALPLSACLPEPGLKHSSRWVGASADRGHRMREVTRSGAFPLPAVQREADVLVVGGGVAGLSALRSLAAAGVSGAQLIELEDSVGGNSRGHMLGGMGCPLGAHYLPVPGPAAIEVSAWLHEIGLLRSDAAGVHANERHLCHSPQERLFIDGAWQDGLLPRSEARPGWPQTLTQYRRFAQRVRELQQGLGFSLPTHRSRWSPGHAALDAQVFSAWLAAEGFADPLLLGHLDYCCRDDYGAGIATVSAWAGIHYFASRHGFAAPGEDTAERDPVFAWPEGNAWLVRELAAPLAGRIHSGRTALRVTENRHGVSVLAWDEARSQAELWSARAVVLAAPLFIAERLLEAQGAGSAAALREAAAATRYAPWLVVNLLLKGPLLERAGAPLSWDNVRYAAAGQNASLGYVNALHQSTRPDAGLEGPQLLTAYFALPEADRPRLLAGSSESWLRDVLADLAPLHPDLSRQLVQADLMRWGHAMSIPAPGMRGQVAREALRMANGRVRFAHADLAGYSVFEEAFTLGALAVAGLRA
jgi:predicted NAD/FAD-dependent oxidoreductase